MPETRKCDNCGKEFVAEKDWHRYCSSKCQREAEIGKGRSAPDSRTNFRFDAAYLRKGYFLDPKCEQLDPDIVDSVALEVAKKLANTGINSHQLRRFFNQVRAVAARPSFAAAKADLVALKSAAAYQVGRGLVREDFKQFIDRNVDLAAQRQENLQRGFVSHFQAVLGFFVYLTRDP